MKELFLLFIVGWLTSAVSLNQADGQVLTGLERTDEYLPILRGKRIGVVANNASVVRGVNTVDTLIALECDVVKIYSPEHGFRRQVEAGLHLDNQIDSLTGVEVISLYGKKTEAISRGLGGG